MSRRRCAHWCSAAAAVLAAVGPGVHADEERPYEVRTISAERANGAISVDGILDEPAWQRAQVGSGFLQTEPDDGAPLRHLAALYECQPGR